MRSSCWTSPSGLPSQPGEGVRVSVVEAVETGFRLQALPRPPARQGDRRLPRRRPHCGRGREMVPPDRVAGAAQDLSRGRLGLSGRESAAASTSLSPAATATRPPSPSGGSSRPTAALRRPRPRRRPVPAPSSSSSSGRGARIRSASTWPPTACPSSATTATATSPSTSACARRPGLRRLLLVAWSLRPSRSGRLVRASLPEHFAAFLALFADAAWPAGRARRAEPA